MTGSGELLCFNFWNAGRLPDELSIELLQKKHPSIPYNPLVASAFFRAGYIEAWGRGIEKINNECKMAGVPAPEINHEFAGLMITFQARSTETRGKTLGKTLGKTPDAILFLLDESPFLSIPEIAERINKSESAVERAIRKLREEGRLKRIGPAKGGHWEIIKE